MWTKPNKGGNPKWQLRFAALLGPLPMAEATTLLKGNTVGEAGLYGPNHIQTQVKGLESEQPSNWQMAA